MNLNIFIHIERGKLVNSIISNKEDNQLKTKLLENGKELFSQKGFKNTSISELTKKCGIAAGTFYNYFNSKEELFLHIFNKEHNQLKKKIMKKVNKNDNLSIVVKELIYNYFKGMQSKPILQHAFKKDIFRKIEKKTKYDPRENGDLAYDIFLPLIKNWQEEYKIVKKDPKYIFAFFESIFYVFLHKDDIGQEYFPDLLDDVINYIVEGIKYKDNN